MCVENFNCCVLRRRRHRWALRIIIAGLRIVLIVIIIMVTRKLLHTHTECAMIIMSNYIQTDITIRIFISSL